MALEVHIVKKLHGFTLRVNFCTEGSNMGVLGASGSGKSMTLRCIAGIETPDEGRIVINGRTLFDSEKHINLKPQERRVGYLFQNYALFPTMTVEKNISCGFRGDKSERKKKVRDYLERYQLVGLEKRYPSQLSGGQQQRVALARMMIGEPEVILLDEPFSALDSYLKDVLQRDMVNFLKEYQGDMILVTHSRDEAYKFCEELTLLKDGSVLIAGETKEIFENPKLVEAARLTGCKNFTAVQKLDDYKIYAADWDIILHTKEFVERNITCAAIRGHWLQPCESSGRNCMRTEAVECVETPFEHQYLVKNKDNKDSSPLWWMKPKGSFQELASEGVPKYIYFPEEHIMLLK